MFVTKINVDIKTIYKNTTSNDIYMYFVIIERVEDLTQTRDVRNFSKVKNDTKSVGAL